MRKASLWTARLQTTNSISSRQKAQKAHQIKIDSVLYFLFGVLFVPFAASLLEQVRECLASIRRST